MADLFFVGRQRVLPFLLLIVLLRFVSACQGIARESVKQTEGTNRQLDTAELTKYSNILSWYFDSLLNSRGFSGGILVAKNGNILYEHYRGDVFGKGTAAIDSTTPFHVASTSKTFTSTAILQLEAKGLLHLNDALSTYWPDFPYPDITIRQLLSHCSGIPDYANFLPRYGWNKKETATNYDVLEVILRKKPGLEFASGSRFKYCNTNFVLLALLVENVTGLTFPIM